MKSYFTECLIKAREGDTCLFEMKQDFEVLAKLRGYAIVPIEEYQKLTQQRLPETLEHYLSD